MPEMISETIHGPKLLTWATDLDDRTREQGFNMAGMPFIYRHAALMADAHLGYGVPIGAVIATKGAIMPAAVGVDIGCGMIAAQTTLNASDLPDDLGPILSSMEKTIPAGVGRGHEQAARGGDVLYFMDRDPFTNVYGEGALMEKACSQMGTLGGGNHFVEVCLDETDTVWIVLHSGSRGIGNLLARKHIDGAKGLMEKYFIELPDPDLAYFVQGTPQFEAYMRDLLWSQEYAFANRQEMMTAAQNALMGHLGSEGFNDFAIETTINCHHNYSEQENHFGENVWVTRKGAIRAREGDLGVIPGSMGTSSFIVRGLGNPSSFYSASHGAGRAMSRTEARKTLSIESFKEAMGDRTWLEGKAKNLLDEHPDSYKDIHQVMAAQADLVEVVTELKSILNYKGSK